MRTATSGDRAIAATETAQTAFQGQERVLEVCRKFGADRYINLAGGRRLYDRRVLLCPF